MTDSITSRDQAANLFEMMVRHFLTKASPRLAPEISPEMLADIMFTLFGVDVLTFVRRTLPEMWQMPDGQLERILTATNHIHLKDEWKAFEPQDFDDYALLDGLTFEVLETHANVDLFRARAKELTSQAVKAKYRSAS